MPVLNLGILAHVDAGKTSLTERLLFQHGAIRRLGSVADGSTFTDSGHQERERGITIRAAVAPFQIRDLQVNIIDTPGHPDFIAEVDRSLSVIDAAVLVISAIEGVEPQTRILLKSLKRLEMPVVVFINKIDQVGADPYRALEQAREILKLNVLPLNEPTNCETKVASCTPVNIEEEAKRYQIAECLGENDLELLTAIVSGKTPSEKVLYKAISKQLSDGLISPVYFGSAITGAGVNDLSVGLESLLNHLERSVGSQELSGKVFAIERNRKGEKVTYVRLFSGELTERRKVPIARTNDISGQSSGEISISRLETVAPTSAHADHNVLTAGNIGKIIGSNDLRVGDYIGEGSKALIAPVSNFAAPHLESVVKARSSTDTVRFASALSKIVEEDPLIQCRQLGGGAVSLLLFGEVQKEVIADRLLRDFGLQVVFEAVTPVFLERPAGIGTALHEMDHRGGPNRFFATIGLRVEPGEYGSGILYDNVGQIGHLPLAFHKATEETVMTTLEQGLSGWRVTDCKVTMTHAGYGSSVSTAADFRQLAPLIIMEALKNAGTQVYEPFHRFELEIPPHTFGVVSSRLGAMGATVSNFSHTPKASLLEGTIAARLIQDFRAALPGLSGGQGLWISYPDRDQPVKGLVPERQRTDGNPLNREEYLLSLTGRNLTKSKSRSLERGM